MSITVLKADGTLEKFQVSKLKKSLRRAGADNQEIAGIIKEIENTIYDGIKTQQIYRQAFALLRESRGTVASRYSLRRAMLNLGPTGFPFEKFLAKLFEKKGYETKVGLVMSGSCAEHEIDLVAYKEDHSFIAEAKFHARPGLKSDLQVALYSYARLLDLRGIKICNRDHVCKIKEFWLITNTKFTVAAKRYGNCVGLKMLSWNYPKENNLQSLIEENKIYPITVLQDLSAKQIDFLFSRNIILCSDLLKKQEVFKFLNLSKQKQQKILTEIEDLLGG